LTPEVWQKVRRILEHALETAPDHRAAYLEQACRGDAALRRELDSLIAASEEAGTEFLQYSAFESPAIAGSAGADALIGKRIGPYQIVEEIGHGGMGSVYLAVRADDQYRKKVAIKLVRGGLGDPFRMHRFKAERQILADLDHPNIARLLDGGALDDGQPYVVMEYVEGRPIDEYCAAHNLSITERLKLFCSVCLAVAYAHRRLVIHRDIKPANILVAETGEPKLLDFGIAKMVDAEGTEQATATVLRQMTPEYASPEQVRGGPITTASDVYSLGVVLYGLLTGAGPYPAASTLPHEIAQAVCEVEPERPSVRAKEVSNRRRLRGDLDNIVLKALRKEPERRYASVEQFADDIGKHLEGLPVTARPDTFWYRSGKFVRRNKAVVAAAAVVALTLIVGLAVTLRAAYIARTERARAVERFNDVRQLANSLVFEVHDAIQNLPGATAARKLIVDRALRYLDTLAKEASGDVSLQRELAAAYQKVGDVQGGFREANLGDTQGAIASYRKSLTILEAARGANPANVAIQRDVLTAHGKLSDLLLMAGDRAGSLKHSKQIVAIAEGLSSADPANPGNRRNLARAYLDYGWKSVGRDDWQRGLEDCRKSVGLLESLVSADAADKQSRRLLALAYSRTAELLSEYARKHDESLAMHRRAIELVRSMLAQDARNSDLRRIEAWERVRVGDELGALAKAVESEQNYRTALEQLNALAGADVNDVEVQTDVAMANSRLGSALLQQGKLGGAEQQFQKSLNACQRLSKNVSSNEDLTWTMAFDQFSQGRVYARRKQWREAQALLRASLPGLEQSKGSSYRALAEGSLVEAHAYLERCDRELNQRTRENSQ